MRGMTNYKNPFDSVSFDKDGVIQFSGMLGENSGKLGNDTDSVLGDNSGTYTGTLGDNDNILFLKNELAQDGTHSFVVGLLEHLGETKELTSLQNINEQYPDFKYTTDELNALMFEWGIFDFVRDWDFNTLKRTYYVFKGLYKMGGNVLAEIKKKNDTSKVVSTGAVDTQTNTKGGL